MGRQHACDDCQKQRRADAAGDSCSDVAGTGISPVTTPAAARSTLLLIYRAVLCSPQRCYYGTDVLAVGSTPSRRGTATVVSMHRPSVTAGSVQHTSTPVFWKCQPSCKKIYVAHSILLHICALL